MRRPDIFILMPILKVSFSDTFMHDDTQHPLPLPTLGSFP